MGDQPRRIRRPHNKGEMGMLQSYLDQKVNDALEPIIEAVYQMQGTVDTLKSAATLLYMRLHSIRHSEGFYDKYPLEVAALIDELDGTLAPLTWDTTTCQAELATMKEQVKGILTTPKWMDDIQQKALDEDLSDLMGDDIND